MADSFVRCAGAEDAERYVQLASTVLGNEYPAKEIYDPAWVTTQLDPTTGSETWIVEKNGDLSAAISLLKPSEWNNNPVINLGRLLFLPESYLDGSAALLIQNINNLANERSQAVVVRVSASDNRQQVLFENAGYACVGFQPFKHMIQARLGVLFYVLENRQMLTTRLPLSESLSQTSELAVAAFESLKISNPITVRDGATGYPLQTELQIHEASFDDYQLWRVHSQAVNPPTEISGTFHLGFGLMRIPSNTAIHALLAQRENTIVAGIAFCLDETDRCVRAIDAFSTDDLSMGALFQQVTKLAQEQFSVVYSEVDILVTAPRLLKTAEQLGYVPVAYLPAFYCKNSAYADVVKLVKLNMPYALDAVDFTTQSRKFAEIVDRNFQDQKVGNAIINLLRGLPIFLGLGDGELRKIARLFTQKLFRPAEQIFKKGDSGDEAYIVMRGQVDIQIEEGKTIATLPSGKIFGELAFLDGAPRNAFAVASQPSILLVVHRGAFNDLIQREPHLGMVVMRNIALDTSNKLRLANTTITQLKQGNS